jgi:energy-coupling factor transport system ATP-binding protein
MFTVEFHIVSNRYNDNSLVAVQQFSYAYDERDWTLRDIDWSIAAGECHCLCGATGSGKSTFALAVKGLLPTGRQQGGIHYRLDSDTPTLRVGLVLQNPESQLFARTVGAEVAFGLENMAVAPQDMVARVEQALTHVGLDLPLGASVATLSMGQKYRLLLASMLVLEPQLLILDEPVAQLDEDGLRDLRYILRRLRHQGVAILICEHNHGPLNDLIDSFWVLDSEGRLASSTPTAAECGRPQLLASAYSSAQTKGATVLTATDLTVGCNEQQPLWRAEDFSWSRGQQVLVVGGNGSGKSTLLRCLCGFLAPLHGEVRLFGQPPQPRMMRGRVGWLLQNPQRQLCENSVYEELALSHRLAGRSRNERADLIKQTLVTCGLDHLEQSSAHKLSYGQKHLVALASLLVSKPQVLLLDDPFAGLDHHYQHRVYQLLHQQSSEMGTLVVRTSHHQPSLTDRVDQLHTISGGLFATQSF